MYQETVLNNGLKIMTENIPHVRSIAMGIWIKAGSIDENKQLTGISHFLEHMMFKGTDNYSAKDLVEIFDSIGSQLNAFTSKEFTCYYAKFLDEHLQLAASTLSDMVLRSVFDPEEIKKEQNVIVEEIKMYEDTPDDLVHDVFTQTAWPSHRLGRPILGTKETVCSFTHETIVNYFSQRYVPSNMIITLAGNLNHQSVVDILAPIWGDLSGNVGSNYYAEPIIEKNISVIEKDIEQIHLCLGGKGITYNQEDKFAVHLLNNVLGGSMSSRLFQSIREEQGLAYSVYSYLTAYRDAGLFTIYSGISSNNLEKVITLIRQEIDQLQMKGVTRGELKKAKEQLKGSLLLGMESTSSRMSRLAKSDLYYGRIIPLEEIVEQIEKVTLDDIAKAANSYLNFNEFSCAIVGPTSQQQLEKILINR